MNKLSIILPCFNEEDNIKRISKELLPVLKDLGEDFEIIIIDDGSTDNSEKEILKIKDIKLIKHQKNLGLGYAIRTGINNADGDLLIILDTDFTFSPKFIPLLLENIKKRPDIDFIIGSPALGGFGKDIKPFRVILSKIANKFYSFLLGRKITAISQIFRLYKTEQLKNFPLESEGYEINAEILFRLVSSGRKFLEIPVPLTQRIYGVSHLNYKKEIIRHFLLVLKIIRLKIFSIAIFQFIKYNLIATITTFLGWVVFNSLIFITNMAQGLIINIFAIIAFIISRICNFLWTKFWIFNKTNNIKQECIKFFGVSGILTIINLFVIHIGVNVIGPSFGINSVVWANIFFILTIPISLFGNFFGYKFFVFR